MPNEIAGVPLKDLLQIGFSFFVAGYLLVKDWKLSGRITDNLVRQTEILGRIERVLEAGSQRSVRE